MIPIKRLGAPEVIDAIGSDYRMSVQLNAAPPPVWWALFRNPGEWNSLCHPRAITLYGDQLVFDAEEEHVPIWVDFIDRWIQAANGEFAVEWKRRRAELVQSPEIRQRRVDAARERFRYLAPA